jgi:ABC-type transport system involved in multi-copper enzyme maturation permease subunit
VNTYNRPLDDLAEAANVWARSAGTLVACLLLITVAVRASSTFSGERDRRTFDSLLTSPLECGSILFAKWLASIASVRWLLLWLGLIWAGGVVTRGVHVLALPLLAVAWLVYAAFLASLGTWFSLVSRTSLRATIWTLLVTVAVSVGHWFVMILCVYIPVQMLASGVESDLEWLPQFELFGLTPPATLALLALHGWEFETQSFFWQARSFWLWLAYALGGLVLWAAAAGILWRVTLMHFRVLAGRVLLRLPDHFVLPRTGSAPVPAPSAEVQA